jgi:single-stranded-DNA-specific exonuclease
LGDKKDLMKKDEKFDIVYTIEENEWDGNITVQLNLKDIKKPS